LVLASDPAAWIEDPYTNKVVRRSKERLALGIGFIDKASGRLIPVFHFRAWRAEFHEAGLFFGFAELSPPKASKTHPCTPPTDGNINKSEFEGVSSKAARDVFSSTILFAIGQLPFAIFHLRFSMENEK
jgi:hypothetical protein